jgi:hypothetical protein
MLLFGAWENRMILQDASEAVIVMECILKNVSRALIAALDRKGPSSGMTYITSANTKFRYHYYSLPK